jgi:tRNA(fMet)-specific endonuclease VapC
VSYILDTNVVSALMKGRPRVIEKLEKIERNDVLLPEPVLAEIAYGIARLPRSKRKDKLVELFGSIRRMFGRATWDDAVTDHFARTKAALEARGNRIGDFDIAVAAHALALDAVLVTANRSHLARVPGLRVEDWSR